jgi:hypothetical protein
MVKYMPKGGFLVKKIFLIINHQYHHLYFVVNVEYGL